MKLLYELLTGRTNLHESVNEYEDAVADAVASLKAFEKKYPNAAEHGARAMKSSLVMKISDDFGVFPNKIRRDVEVLYGDQIKESEGDKNLKLDFGDSDDADYYYGDRPEDEFDVDPGDDEYDDEDEEDDQPAASDAEVVKSLQSIAEKIEKFGVKSEARLKYHNVPRYWSLVAAITARYLEANEDSARVSFDPPAWLDDKVIKYSIGNARDYVASIYRTMKKTDHFLTKNQPNVELEDIIKDVVKLLNVYEFSLFEISQIRNYGRPTEAILQRISDENT